METDRDKLIAALKTLNRMEYRRSDCWYVSVCGDVRNNAGTFSFTKFEAIAIAKALIEKEQADKPAHDVPASARSLAELKAEAERLIAQLKDASHGDCMALIHNHSSELTNIREDNARLRKDVDQASDRIGHINDLYASRTELSARLQLATQACVRHDELVENVAEILQQAAESLKGA